MGLATALLAFSLLAMQVAMGSRLHILDRAFGLDVVLLFHRGMGIFATLLLITHPVLIAIGARSAKLFGFHTSWKVDLGKASLLLLILGVAFALSFSRLRIDYNLWRIFHKLMVVVLLLGFIHAIYIGPDLRTLPMAVYWTTLFTVAMLLFIWQNVFVDSFGRHRLAVASVTQETHDTFTIEMKPRSGHLFDYRPGQFMFLTFASAGLVVEEHPFTISSSPTRDGSITATIKQSGNFTNRINAVKPGDRVYAQAPFGRYSFTFHDSKSLVFIAGGVGITPIRSMMAYLRDTGDTRPVTLIYGNKTEDDIIFRKEFDALPPHMKVNYILSKPGPAWTGLKGYVTADAIKNCAADRLADSDFFVCGPPVMMDMAIAALRPLNIPYSRIFMERFTL
jgi:predicted ferric reductase